MCMSVLLTYQHSLEAYFSNLYSDGKSDTELQKRLTLITLINTERNKNSLLVKRNLKILVIQKIFHFSVSTFYGCKKICLLFEKGDPASYSKVHTMRLCPHAKCPSIPSHPELSLKETFPFFTSRPSLHSPPPTLSLPFHAPPPIFPFPPRSTGLMWREIAGWMLVMINLALEFRHFLDTGTLFSYFC